MSSCQANKVLKNFRSPGMFLTLRISWYVVLTGCRCWPSGIVRLLLYWEYLTNEPWKYNFPIMIIRMMVIIIMMVRIIRDAWHRKNGWIPPPFGVFVLPEIHSIFRCQTSLMMVMVVMLTMVVCDDDYNDYDDNDDDDLCIVSLLKNKTSPMSLKMH